MHLTTTNPIRATSVARHPRGVPYPAPTDFPALANVDSEGFLAAARNLRRILHAHANAMAPELSALEFAINQPDISAELRPRISQMLTAMRRFNTGITATERALSRWHTDVQTVRRQNAARAGDAQEPNDAQRADDDVVLGNRLPMQELRLELNDLETATRVLIGDANIAERDALLKEVRPLLSPTDAFALMHWRFGPRDYDPRDPGAGGAGGGGGAAGGVMACPMGVPSSIQTADLAYNASWESQARLFAAGQPIKGNIHFRQFTFADGSYARIQAKQLRLLEAPSDAFLHDAATVLTAIFRPASTQTSGPLPRSYNQAWQGYSAHYYRGPNATLIGLRDFYGLTNRDALQSNQCLPEKIRVTQSFNLADMPPIATWHNWWRFDTAARRPELDPMLTAAIDRLMQTKRRPVRPLVDTPQASAGRLIHAMATQSPSAPCLSALPNAQAQTPTPVTLTPVRAWFA